MRKQPTAEQKAKAEARRARFRDLAKSVAEMTDEQRQQIVDKFGAVVTCEGRVLSHFNTCLLFSQTDGKASMVGGFNQWKDKGRSVKKGEHGLMIWIPSMRGQTEAAVDAPTDSEAAKPGFIMGTVFDVMQTEEIEVAQAMVA